MRYRLQRHDGTDCSATMVPITVLRMVPIQRYRQYLFFLLKTYSGEWNSIRYLHNLGKGLAMDVVSSRYLAILWVTYQKVE